MKCDYRADPAGGFVCHNCANYSETLEEHDCTAEVTFEELLAMHGLPTTAPSGPQRTVLITGAQAQQLAAAQQSVDTAKEILRADMHCRWQLVRSGMPQRIRCEHCRIELETRLPLDQVVLLCGSKDPPPMLRRILNYAHAQTHDLVDGRRRRTPARVHQIYHQHCSGCSLNIQGTCIHQDCGCPVNNSTAMKNKLALASTECPLKLWGPEPADSPYVVQTDRPEIPGV
jgi:hypothetical protein